MLGLVLVGACVQVAPPPAAPPPPPPAPVPVEPAPLPEPVLTEPPPEIAREFRAVWVATVGNIDWPSSPGLPTEQQQAELIGILDRAKALGLNAVIFQVRPGADALYPSSLEPWSEYLTGTMGRAPEPFYDPLEFAVREAHLRGLELHAWFNPYRARHPSGRSPISADHISRTRPDLAKRYGTHIWMDPGEPEVQDRTVDVILDVVRRYDVDGIHIDDYFYPYQERNSAGRLIAFPDDASYARYRATGGTLERADWRRSNVDRLVERLYREIKDSKRWVKFGISPFGIWRPGYPEGVTGLDAYESLYADARKWLANGWVDYFSPQLYWRIDQEGQRYPLLLDWWVRQNQFGRHIWPGNYLDRVQGDGRGWPAGEILAQIERTRSHGGAGGNVLFSMTTLLKDPDRLSEQLREGPYAEPALVPASPWLGSVAPEAPRLTTRWNPEGGLELAVEPGGEEPVRLWAIQSRELGRWTTLIVTGDMRTVLLPGLPEVVAVRAVGRTGMAGEVAAVRPGDDGP